MKRTILITGGAGFIGSHVVRLFVTKYPDYRIVNLDKLTYAGNLANLRDIEDSPNYVFEKGDICDLDMLRALFGQYDIDGVIHLAAESHVDRSIRDPFTFARTNVLGTLSLLEAAREYWNGDWAGKLFYHISTDEVYGALELTRPEGDAAGGESGGGPFGEEFFTEETKYAPHSPYSASKASSDHFVRAYHDTYGMPTLVTNCSNNYGPYQFPEKLIPLFINNIRHQKPLPVYGRGQNVRDWLYVEDHARAIDVIFHRGKVADTYNIGGFNEWKNIDLIRVIVRTVDRLLGNPEGSSEKLITYVTDRAGHDLRYAIDSRKLKRELGWQPSLQFEEGIEKTVRWYLQNQSWMDDITSGEYQQYYQSMYKDRYQSGFYGCNVRPEMQEISPNNKRIAKNTLLLYFRMLFTMAVSLYTSRVVLNILGVEDFGIYNVVGGIVAMFGFINGSMASATQRYLTFELGQDNRNQLAKVFATSLSIHAIISFFIVLLAETIGLWFLWNKMQIPADRMNAAFWVFQCSVAASVIMIMSVPYNAAIIAHEKMSAFAYISIIEVSFKLLVVYFLQYFHVDKLILYAVLIVIVQFIIRLCYSWYCNRHFKETKYRWIWDKTLFCEMTGLAGWNLFGNFAAITFTQGLNLLLNMFFGSVVNAARGIAVQAQTAIGQFSNNFQTALNPQITKSYATGDREYMHSLIFGVPNFPFFLLLFLSLPILIETKAILTLWLKIVPDHTVVFLRIMLCTTWVYAISNPLITAASATGKIKLYQSVVGGLLLLILPISYLCLRLGLPAYSVLIVHLGMEITAQFARLWMLRRMIRLSLREYFTKVIWRISKVTIIALAAPLAVAYWLPGEGIWNLLTICLICAISTSMSVYWFGLTSGEKIYISSRISSIVSKFRK